MGTAVTPQPKGPFSADSTAELVPLFHGSKPSTHAPAFHPLEAQSSLISAKKRVTAGVLKSVHQSIKKKAKTGCKKLAEETQICARAYASSTRACLVSIKSLHSRVSSQGRPHMVKFKLVYAYFLVKLVSRDTNIHVCCRKAMRHRRLTQQLPN